VGDWGIKIGGIVEMDCESVIILIIGYHQLGQLLLGELEEENLTPDDQLMLADIWPPLDLHKTVPGVRGKLALVGNTWCARW